MREKMNSRDRVRRTVAFQIPDRLACDLSDPYPNDFLTVKCDPDPDWVPKIHNNLEWEDEWGCIWSKLDADKTMGQVTYHPLADFNSLKSYRFPDYAAPARYATARQRIAGNIENKFVLATSPALSFIHRLEFLRGHEAAWIDPIDNPDKLHDLLDRLAGLAIQTIDEFSKIGVDGIFSCDDWGLQDRPLVNPATFKEFWAPYYKRVYHHAHEKNMLTFLHSCGHIVDLLDIFIESELDVIQMDQQENMGLDILGEHFAGRICFWCPVDIQNTMVNGSIDDVRHYARDLIKKLGTSKGGFIAKWYSSPQSVEHDWDKIHAMCKAFIEYGS